MSEPRRSAALPAADLTARLVGSSLSSHLARWAAEARVEDAARRRAGERWLRQQAEESGSLAGVLTDLAERGAAVVIRTRGGRQHRGRVHTVGLDLVALDSADTGPVNDGLTDDGLADVGVGGAGQTVLALAAVASVRPQVGQPAVTGDRPLRTSLRLAEVLAGLAAERERARLVTLGGEDAVTGTVQAVGRDVIAVRTEAQAAAIVYIPLAAVGEVTLGVS